MKLLLDTHTFLWFVRGDGKMPLELRDRIADIRTERLLSLASLWEMAIKHNIGKLSFTVPFREFIDRQLSLNTIDILNINIDHIEVMSSLPLHHRDPFDRLLIAQAITENIPFASRDAIFDAYPVRRLW